MRVKREGGLEFYLSDQNTVDLAKNLVAWNVGGTPRAKKRTELEKMLRSVRASAKGEIDSGKGYKGVVNTGTEAYDTLLDRLSRYAGTDAADAGLVVDDAMHMFSEMELDATMDEWGLGEWQQWLVASVVKLSSMPRETFIGNGSRSNAAPSSTRSR